MTGTPAYFPPESELLDNEPDERSDAYSFAVMAYELLTGRLPFDGLGMLEMIAAHLAQDPPPPESIVPGFPPAASRALLAGLEKDPVKRPLPLELVERLEAVPATQWHTPVQPRPGNRPSNRTVLKARPVPAPVGDQPRPRARRVKRSHLAALVVAVVAAAIVGGVAAAAMTSDSPQLVLGNITTAVTPADGQGRCPAADFEFSARLRTNGEAGTVRLQWLLPDGRITAPVTLQARAGQRAMSADLRFAVTGEQPLNGPAVLRVLAPESREARTPTINYRC